MKKKNLLIIILISLILTGGFYLDNRFQLGLSRQTVRFLRPVGVVFADLGSRVGNFFGYIGNIGDLNEENKRLKADLDQALSDIAKLSEAKKENQSLRADLGFKENSGFDTLSAKVIFFDPTNIRETITINAGSDDGVKEGSVVISQGYLVGKTVFVGPKSAKIRLITDPESAIPATVERIAVAGIVKGRIGSGMVLDQIPQSEKIENGSLVLTSGIGGGYPKGLIIGQIDDIQKISGSIFQKIELKPMINFDRLERVLVIKE